MNILMLGQSRDLTDAQWVLLHPLMSEPERREDGRGRPWRDRREVLNGILFMTHRCSVGRSARALSSLSDLSSSVPATGALRCDARCAAGRSSVCPWRI